MKIAFGVLLMLCAVSYGAKRSVSAPPVFPLDWTSVEEDFLIVYQGNYVQQGNLYCCGDDNCEIQTEYQSGHNYFDFTNNRTRFDDPVQGSIVSLFYPTYKEMAVDGTDTCTSYCPIEDDLTPYAIDPNATDEGKVTIGNVTTELWQFKQTIGGIIVMEIDNIYVVQSTGLPALEVDQITPFGQPIGEETTTYTEFIPGTPDPSHFNIKNVASCPLDANCGDDRRQHHRLRSGARKTWLHYYQKKNLAKVGKVGKPRSAPRRPRH